MVKQGTPSPASDGLADDSGRTPRTIAHENTRADGPRDLTPQQWHAVNLILLGQSDTEVAAAVGVRRETVNVWRNRHPYVRAVLAQRRAEIWAGALDRLRNLLPVALSVLEQTLRRPEPDPKLALDLLRLCGLLGHPALVETGLTDPEAYIATEVRQQRSADQDPLTAMLEDMLGGPTPSAAERQRALASLLDVPGTG